MDMLTANARAGLLRRLNAIQAPARMPAAGLPDALTGTLAGVRTELTAPQPDCERLRLLGRAIIAWHLDQGFTQVPLHAALAELGEELIGLGA